MVNARGRPKGRAWRGRDLLSPEEWERARATYKLTGREVSVVKCVFDGMTTDEIADRLDCSRHTVVTHLRRIRRKIRRRGRVSVVVAIVRAALKR